MTSKRSLTTAFRFRLDFAILTRSSNMSAMAYRRAPGSAFRAFSAAPASTSAATNQTDLQYVTSRCIGSSGNESRSGTCQRAGRGRCCKKLRRWLVPVKSSLGLSCIVSEIDVGSFWFNWESPMIASKLLIVGGKEGGMYRCAGMDLFQPSTTTYCLLVWRHSNSFLFEWKRTIY